MKGKATLGHPAGQTGVCWPVSQEFPVVYCSLQGYLLAGGPRDPLLLRETCQEVYCFSYVPSFAH